MQDLYNEPQKEMETPPPKTEKKHKLSYTEKLDQDRQKRAEQRLALEKQRLNMYVQCNTCDTQSTQPTGKTMAVVIMGILAICMLLLFFLPGIGLLRDMRLQWWLYATRYFFERRLHYFPVPYTVVQMFIAGDWEYPPAAGYMLNYMWLVSRPFLLIGFGLIVTVITCDRLKLVWRRGVCALWALAAAGILLLLLFNPANFNRLNYTGQFRFGYIVPVEILIISRLMAINMPFIFAVLIIGLACGLGLMRNKRVVITGIVTAVSYPALVVVVSLIQNHVIGFGAYPGFSAAFPWMNTLLNFLAAAVIVLVGMAVAVFAGRGLARRLSFEAYVEEYKE